MSSAPPDKTADRIARMFDAIAPRYDLLNRLLSAGIDRSWRAAAIQSLQLTGREVVLDVCTGTADVAIAARRGGAARVVGVDFAGRMLALGWRKVLAVGEGRSVVLIRGDAMRLPARDASVDAVTIAFGIRNVERIEVGCAEMARVLRPGGRLAILELGVPRVPGLSALYRYYFTRVLPAIGRRISSHPGAYSYLPASVGAFPPPDRFLETLRAAGFVDTRARAMTLGIVHLYTGRRAPAGHGAQEL